MLKRTYLYAVKLQFLRLMLISQNLQIIAEHQTVYKETAVHQVLFCSFYELVYV